MSRVKIEGNASGTGTLTIAAPNTNTDRTLTLPDGAGEILLSNGDGSNLTGISSGFTVHKLVSGTSFSPKTSSSNMYVAILGSTGGYQATSIYGRGGIGGSGFSEKLYTGTLASSYSYSVGAGGTTSGTDGGTSTFDVMTVTGGGGITNSSTSGASGGVGSGGDFNATGGTGGNGNAATGNPAVGMGACGGAGTRAGNGGNGSNYDTTNGAGSGGTGGNNGSSGTAGAAATAASASAIDLEAATGLSIIETFAAGRVYTSYSISGGIYYWRCAGGASCTLSTSLPYLADFEVSQFTSTYETSYAGTDAIIIVIEW